MTPGSEPIDRRALVGRHDVLLDRPRPDSPLSVGNGEFCVTVDVTGLQTLGEYGRLLGTMSHWGWDSSPGRVPLDEQLHEYATPHGPALYADYTGTAAEEWLRNNPHRIDLGRVGLWAGNAAEGRPLAASDLSEVAQRLELFSGTITSRFRLRGRAFSTRTAVHPERDALAVAVEGTGEFGLRLAFPAGSEAWGDAADWSHPETHTSELEQTDAGWRIRRRLHEAAYTVELTAPGARLERVASHEFVLRASGARLDAVVEFSPNGAVDPPLSDDRVFAAAARHWNGFWNAGGALELAGSDDPRAPELERRVVLSQYLSALSAGSLPPAETGLMLNSWRGKFHLEMHWWHHGWLPQWGRPELLERSLAWYPTVLGRARETARGQRLPGARWPKQVGPDGREAPSSIGAFLVWQQPHPIHLAELVYRTKPRRDVLERWADVVVATAEFMAAFASPGPAGLELGPPVIPAQESYEATRATARDPAFELAYWSWALDVAARWLERLGRTAPARWREVAHGMSPLPERDGTYLALGTPPYLTRTDHPSMLGALGVVPKTHMVDADTMLRTLRDVLSDWDWATTWGWDFPMAAMTATRLGEPELAVNALLLDVPKNTYLANGHNRQDASLPIYLPGNGGLLLATGLMAAGFDGSGPTPGFGQGWRPRWEGITRLP